KADRNGPDNGGSSRKDQHQQDFFCGIGHGGDRVRGKNRECDSFRQPFVCCLSTFERIANQPTLQNHRRHYLTLTKTCTLKKRSSDVRGRKPCSSMQHGIPHERKRESSQL